MPGRPSAPPDSVGAAGHQRVHQRVVPVARRGMHHQAGRLVDDGEVLVLEDDGERDGGGLEGAGRLVVGNPDGRRARRGRGAGRRGRSCPFTSTRLRRPRGGRPGCGRGRAGRRGIGRGARSPRPATVKRQLRQPRRTPVRGPAGVLPPERDRERDGAAAHRDVGDVEGRPAERADADVEEVHHAAARCGSGRSGCRPRRRPPGPGRAGGTGRPPGRSRDIRVEHEHRDAARPRRRSSASRGRRAARTRRPGCRPGGAGTSRRSTEIARRAEQRGLGDQLGDQVEHHRRRPPPPRTPGARRRVPDVSGACHPLPSPCR